MCSKFNSFAPQAFETTLFQNGCLSLRSPASSELRLKLKGSVMSVSFQAWPGDLQTAANRTSLLPVGVQTPVPSIETSGVGLHGCGKCLFELRRPLTRLSPRHSFCEDPQRTPLRERERESELFGGRSERYFDAEGGRKSIDCEKVPRLRPLVLLVRVGWKWRR
jgi:hypothetical protein